MPPKTGTTDVELKIRIPRELMDELNDYRHLRKLDSRKEAVIELLRSALDTAKVAGNGMSAGHTEDLTAKEGQSA